MSTTYIYESAQDHFHEASALLASDGQASWAQEPAGPIEETRCHVCGTAVSPRDRDLASLARHLRTVHPSEHVYVRANDQVIRSRAFLHSGLTSLQLCADEGREYEIRATWSRGCTTQRLRGVLDLSEVVGSDVRGSVNIRVALPDGTMRDFTLYVQDAPPFSPQQLHPAIDRLLQSVARGREPAEVAARVTELQACPQATETDQQYANAFIDFAWGIHRERGAQLHPAGDKLGAAVRALSGFRTSRARAASCVLGVRLNAFHLLAQARPDWPIEAAGRFFGHPSRVAGAAPEPGTREKFPIAVDRFTECLLRCIEALEARPLNMARIATLQAELASLPAAVLPDNATKLYLFNARAAVHAGQRDEACAAYERLVEDLIFGAEAKAYIDRKEGPR